MTSGAANFWIGVAAAHRAEIAVDGGYIELNHGKAGPLDRMRPGDGFAFYSPRATWPDGAPLQAFTALGRVRDAGIYQTGDGDDFRPFRRAVDWLPARAAPIRPLLAQLDFIRNKVHWGASFRFGFLRVPAADFARIAAAMGRRVDDDFAGPG